MSNATIHYGQNLYQQQASLDYGDREVKSKHHSSKVERDEVLPFHNVNQSAWNPSNGSDYSSHLLSASLPISIQHFLKYSETIKKESSTANSNGGNMNMNILNTGSDLLNLKNGSNLLGNVASMVNQHHLNQHQHHNFMNGNDNNMDHHASGLNIPNHNSSMLLNQNSSGLNMKSPTMVPIPNSVPPKVKKERKKSAKQTNAVKKPKKKKPPKERKPRPKVNKKHYAISSVIYNLNCSPAKFVKRQPLMELFCIVALNVRWHFLSEIW